MAFAPVLDPDRVAKERQVVIEELRMSLDNPQDHIGTLFDEVMYPDRPWGGTWRAGDRPQLRRRRLQGATSPAITGPAGWW